MDTGYEHKTRDGSRRQCRGDSALSRRALAMVAGLAALGLTIESVISGVSTPLSALWFWPANLGLAVKAFTAVRSVPPELLRLLIGEIVAHIFAIVASFRLAARIDRHRWDWTVFSFLFPPVAILLALLPLGKAAEDRWGGVLGRILYALISLIGLSQRCGNCGKKVPLYMMKGETCPHCGIVWIKEKTVHE